jgi:hypothetical protein
VGLSAVKSLSYLGSDYYEAQYPQITQILLNNLCNLWITDAKLGHYQLLLVSDDVFVIVARVNEKICAHNEFPSPVIGLNGVDYWRIMLFGR